MRTVTRNAAESELTSALVAMVGDARPAVTPDQVSLHLIDQALPGRCGQSAGSLLPF
jgi:hypothetical protein